MQLVSMLASELFLVLVAIACLIWPQRIQEFGASHHGLFFYYPFKSLMRTRWYLWTLRATGVLALGAAAVVGRSIVRYLLTR